MVTHLKGYTLALALAVAVFGQSITTGVVTGIVTDPSGGGQILNHPRIECCRRIGVLSLERHGTFRHFHDLPRQR